MTKEEAMQHGLGYACGREDASHLPTLSSPSAERIAGWYDFARAYAEAWDDFNHERRGYMPNCRDSYEAWQASGGKTIFRDSLRS